MLSWNTNWFLSVACENVYTEYYVGLCSPRDFSNMKVALLGLPGAGKTSLGRRLSSLLSIPCIDVDDDILEPTWGCTVAEKLATVGDQKFLQAEEEALLEVCGNFQTETFSYSSGKLTGREWDLGVHR